MTKQRNKKIVFDFDGTIADSLPVIYEVGNKVLTDFGKTGLTPEALERLKEKEMKIALKQMNISPFRFPFLLLKIQVGIYKRVDEISFFPGIKEMFSDLESDFHLEILTNNRVKTVNKFLKNNKVDCFNSVVGNLFLRKKERKLKKFKRRGAIAYVGDQITDITAAKGAGLKAVGVDWGFDSREELKEAGADFVAENPEDLKDFLTL